MTAQKIAKFVLDDDTYVHTARVAARCTGDAHTVAWLHDVLEDTTFTCCDLFYGGIEFHLVACVQQLTRIKMFETYREYIHRLSCSPLAVTVKLADLYDNLHRLPSTKPHLRPRYLWARSFLENLNGKP